MATKLDQSSAAESQQAKPSLAPKLSIFGTKAGFVIPKNKLAGSLVIRGSSTKNETPAVSKEEHNKHVQRKTKWAPDLALEPAVCKGRALAYQVRLDQITKRLKPGDMEMGKIECSLSTAEGPNSEGVDDLKENEGKVQHLELERQEIIGEILRLNPGYKAPDDYKPILKETKIPLQGKADPGHSVIGVLIGSERDTQKRLQEETGATIKVYGTKKINGEKSEICDRDIDEAQAAYEDLHVNVSADSYDKVDAAVALIDLLLAPISVNSAATSTTSTISSAVTSDAVNPDVQLIQSTTPQPGLVHYQSHKDPWLSAPQTYAPSLPSSMPVSSSLPNNSFQPPVSSFSIPPYTGQSPHMNTMPRNPLPVPGHPSSIPNIQQPPPQFRANPSVGPSFGQPPRIGPQLTPSSSVPPPVRPLQVPHASGGWPNLSPVTSQSQRPPQGSPSFMPVRPPISVSPLGAASPQGPIAMMPPSNTPTHYRSQHPQVANINPSATLLSRPPAQPFPSVPPQGPSSMQVLPFHAGASAQSPYPLPMQVRPTMSTPDTVRGPSPTFSQVGSAPGMVPSSIGSSCPPASAPANTNCIQAPGAAWRPPRPAAGDFTFRPVVSHSPTPEFAASGSHMGIHGGKNPGLPHAPFFRPGNQGFQRPLDGRPMGQPWMHAPPPHLAGAFPRNQFPAGFHPAVQPGGQLISPPMPAPSDLSNFLPSRPFQLVPRPQQNPFANTHRQGENPIYDPFSPTEASGAKKTDADAEYEDLMASVGVK